MTLLTLLVVYLITRRKGRTPFSSNQEPLMPDQLWDIIRSHRGEITTLKDRGRSLDRINVLLERDLQLEKDTTAHLRLVNKKLQEQIDQYEIREKERNADI